MRKLLLVNMAVAALAAGALMSDRAQATTLSGSAGARSAVEGASPIEQVTYGYGYRRYHRPYAYYPYRYRYRSYGYYPRRFYGHYGYYPRRFHRRHWHGY